MPTQQRYRRIWKTALMMIIDFLAIFVGTITVYLIRYNWFFANFLGTRKLDKFEYLFVSFAMSTAVVIVFIILGMYDLNAKRGIWKNAVKLAVGVFTVLLTIITYFFFYEYNRNALPEGVPISRFILATGGFVALYFVYLGRLFVWALEQLLLQFNIGKSDIAIIGAIDQSLYEYFEKQNQIGEIYEYRELNQKNLNELELMMKNQQISEVYLYGKNSGFEVSLAEAAERYKAAFIFAPEGFSGFQSFALRPVEIGKKLFLEVQHSNLDGWQVVIKRVFDIVFAGLFLLAFSWVYLIIAIAIKIDSKGSVFYPSERIGPNGKVFKLWKFRRLKQEFCTTEKNAKALQVEAELIAKNDLRKDGVLYKIADDPRATRVGKLIEKYSFDELPQFFNVLLGNMSLVGPRPHQPREVAKYQKHHFKVLNIKPGITGLAQINGRSDLQFEQEVVFDRYYIEHWSFLLDLWIIVKTPLVVLFSRHKASS